MTARFAAPTRKPCPRPRRLNAYTLRFTPGRNRGGSNRWIQAKGRSVLAGIERAVDRPSLLLPRKGAVVLIPFRHHRRTAPCVSRLAKGENCRDSIRRPLSPRAYRLAHRYALPQVVTERVARPNCGYFTEQGFGMSPLLKLLYVRMVVKPGAGYTVCRSGPNSVVELPPKWLIVPGMKLPPSCQVQVPSIVRWS